jgi:probable phosphoglycerate mutase
MTTTLYLIRHGETVWNREHRIQGSLDSPLTWRGCEQARRLGERLHLALEYDAVDRDHLRFQVSPLPRTLQTAAIIGEVLGVPFGHWERDARLRELAWGEWEGLRYEDIEARSPGAMAERERDRWSHRPPGGETYGEGFQRAGQWLAGLPGEATLVVVSHGGIGRLLRGRYLGLEPAAILPLDAPQDALFRLQGKSMDRLEVSEIA